MRSYALIQHVLVVTQLVFMCSALDSANSAATSVFMILLPLFVLEGVSFIKGLAFFTTK